MIKIFKTPEFDDWFGKQTEKSRVQIDDRLSKIQNDEYFGVHRFVGNDKDDVWELKWKNGRRVYYTYIPENSVFILLGGIKNAQSKNIKQAESLYRKYVE